MWQVGRGGYGLGAGCAAPPPPGPPLTPGAAAQRKDWAPWVRCLPPLPSHGRGAGSPNALWAPARRTSPMKPPPHCRRRCPPPWGGGGGQGTHRPPSPNSVCWRAPPAASTSRGCPSWCLEQQCRTPRCPLHDLHAGARCTSHRLCMGRRCPTLLVPAHSAGGGRCGCGSLPPGAYGAAPFGASAPAPASRAGCTSAAS